MGYGPVNSWDVYGRCAFKWRGADDESQSGVPSDVADYVVDE